MRARIRRWGLAALVLALGALVWRSVAVRTAEEAEPPPPAAGALGEPDPRTGAVLVDLHDDVDADDRSRIARRLGAAIRPHAWPSGPSALGRTLSKAAQLFRLTPPAGEADDVLEALADDPDVEAVERERVWRLPEPALEATRLDLGAGRDVDGSRPGKLIPNDPYYKHQWHLDQIQMPKAWTRTKGKGVVVAVIDTGVLYRSAGRFKKAPDLAQTKLVPGRDMVSRDDTPDDEHGHGTHVAGTIAQSTNNKLGVAGVAPGAAIMPIRVLDKNGSGRWGTVAAGIRWAADHGAHVINMSLGGGMPSQTIRRAVDYAHNKGVVVVAAAGNASRSHVDYPAGHRNVIAVGAVRYDEQLTFYSSWGKGLDLVAPGGDLRVDQNGDGLPDGVLQNTMVRGDPSRHDYLAFQGTSMAAPHVAGVAALLRASGVRDPDAVESILEKTAKDKRDKRRYAAGLTQADDALRAAQQGLGGLRGLLAGLLAAGLLLGLRRRGKLDGGWRSATLVAVAVAGGLGLVPWDLLGLGELGGPLSAGLLGGLSGLAGSAAAALALSALPAFAAVALLLGAPRARPLVVGLGLGSAAALTLESVLPTTPVGLLPAALVGPWLLANAAVCAWLGRMAAVRR